MLEVTTTVFCLVTEYGLSELMGVIEEEITALVGGLVVRKED